MPKGQNLALAEVIWHGVRTPIRFGTGVFTAGGRNKFIQTSMDDVKIDGYLPFVADDEVTVHEKCDASFVERKELGRVSRSPEQGGFLWHCVNLYEESYVGDAFSLANILQQANTNNIEPFFRPIVSERIRDFVRMVSALKRPRGLSNAEFLFSFHSGQILPRSESGNLAAALNASAGAIEEEITAFFDKKENHSGDNPVLAAMRYAVSGGKRLRGHLVREVAGMFGASGSTVDKVAMAVEFLHAYSLVHDDLPCLDDDDLRRGKPTVHIKWDEATAVLAGDALQTAAFEILTDGSLDIDPKRMLRIIGGFSSAAGVSGMIKGQILDIGAETSLKPLSLSEIDEIQDTKTGALLQASCLAGALLGNATEEDLRSLSRFGSLLGRAFQIADDILDVEGDQNSVGKSLRMEASSGKSTYVSLLGLDGARNQVQEMMNEAVGELDRYGAKSTGLRDLTRLIVSRES